MSRRKYLGPTLRSTPNAKRCLRQARIYFWHMCQCIKSALKWQWRGV